MLKEKLTSRKFWMAIITIIVGILGVFGVADTTVETVSSLALILVPGIVYIFTEGRIDAAAVAKQIDFDALLEQIGELFKIKEKNSEVVNNQEAVKTLEAVQAATTAGGEPRI